MLAYRDSGSLFLTLVLEQPHQEWKLSRLIFNELLFLGVEQSEVLRVSSPQIPDRDVFPILKTIGIPDMFQGVSLGDLNFVGGSRSRLPRHRIPSQSWGRCQFGSLMRCNDDL